MSKVKAFLTVLFSAIGVFAAREFYKPRNIRDLLKWRGVKLASDKRAWDSMFFENQKELEEMNIGNSDELWGWCNGRFKQNNLNDENELSVTKKYCSDNPTTIMARILREGEENRIIKSENKEAFKVNYLLSTNREAVLELIGYKEQPEDVSKIADQFSKWCKEQETVKVANSNEKQKLVDFKTRCYNLELSNFKSLLKKQGRNLLTTEESFRNKFGSAQLEHAPDFIKDLKFLFGEDDEQIKKLKASTIYLKELRNFEEKDLLGKGRWKLFQWWCEGNLNKSLIIKDTQESNIDFYNRFSSRCSE